MFYEVFSIFWFIDHVCIISTYFRNTLYVHNQLYVHETESHNRLKIKETCYEASFGNVVKEVKVNEVCYV